MTESDVHAHAQRIKALTIEAQLAREFSARLNTEADAWLAEATAKRQRAIEFSMKADALTQQAGLIREAARTPNARREKANAKA